MEFATAEQAWDWLASAVDDPCIDNTRLAYLDDPYAVLGYRLQQQDGCCGCYDAAVTIAGRPALIGCNYGH
jgi:hypothetical protein